MLRLGVTGGIGSGKSTVSRRLGELGAVVIDADQVAREIVEIGEPALKAIEDRFGPAVIRPDGSLDRAGLAAIVFPDPEALAALEAITGPAIKERVALLRQQIPDDVISVYDMPLLVERGLWVQDHLTIVVEVDTETRIRRLVELRGLEEPDVRHRIASQASDAERRAVSDVVLTNDGTPAELVAAVDELWRERLQPWDANLVAGRRSRRPEELELREPTGEWAPRGARVVARLAAALVHEPVTEVEHIGSTAVPGLVAKDVVDVQVGVRSLEAADTDSFRAAMRAAGYVESVGNLGDTPHPAGADPNAWPKRFYGGSDPAEHVHVHVRENGSAGWRFALLFRNWLVANPAERDAYAALKRRLAASYPRTTDYTADKEPWFETAYLRARAWARDPERDATPPGGGR